MKKLKRKNHDPFERNSGCKGTFQELKKQLLKVPITALPDLTKFFILYVIERRAIALWVKMKVTQSCLTLCDPMDYTVHGILQARILKWVAFTFSRGSSQPRDRTHVSCITRGFFTAGVTKETQEYCSGQPFPSPANLPHQRIEPGPPALQADSLPVETYSHVNCSSVVRHIPSAYLP